MWLILRCDWQVHLRDRSGVCADGAADPEEDERDDWLARWRRGRTLLSRFKTFVRYVCYCFYSLHVLPLVSMVLTLCALLLNRGRHLQYVQCDDCSLQVLSRGQDQGDVCRPSPCPLHI